MSHPKDRVAGSRLGKILQRVYIFHSINYSMISMVAKIFPSTVRSSKISNEGAHGDSQDLQ